MKKLFISSTANKQSSAIKLAHKLVASNALPDSSPFHLHVNEHSQLQLIHEQSQQKSTVLVDFSNKTLQHKVNNSFNTKSGLIRAVSVRNKPRHETTVIDATAGLGNDAYVISTFGFPMIWIERNPIIYSLLRDGFERITTSTVLSPPTDVHHQQRLFNCQSVREVLNIEACEYVPNVASQKVDVIYLDPMFTSESVAKKSTPKKGMQALRSLYHQSQFLSISEQIAWERKELDQLIEWARSFASSKVILKRPKTAPKHPLVTHSYSESDNIRFDAISIDRCS